MVSNDRIRKLIEADRDALVELMAFARADGALSGGAFDLWQDTDARALINEARNYSALRVIGRKALDMWNEWAGVTQ